MTAYASVAQEILDTPLRQPDWVRERIAESDLLRDRLEEINLREADEQERIGDKAKQRRVPHLLQLEVRHLAAQVEVLKPVPYYPIPLLDLVFEIQEALFEQGGYRRWREPEEEGAL